VAKVVALTKENPGILLANFAAHLAGKDIKPAGYAGDVRRFTDWVTRKYGDFSSASVSTLDVVVIPVPPAGHRQGPGHC
jgi:hypothetical protein